MRFTVLPRGGVIPPSEIGSAFLIEDKWDDWAKFRTMFALVVFDESGRRHEPGCVKLGERGLVPGAEGSAAPGIRAPTIAQTFTTLDERHFSLGQSADYYETLNQLSDELRVEVLTALRDCAFDPTIFAVNRGEEVMDESLLRSVSATNVENSFRRLAHGNAILTRFDFKYTLPPEAGDGAPTLTFLVTPKVEPPTNIHVLIGRNGVGKTRCLQGIANAIVAAHTDPTIDGTVEPKQDDPFEWTFAGLIAVSFSAFDKFKLPSGRDARSGIRASIIGLSTGQSNSSVDKPVTDSGGPDVGDANPESAEETPAALPRVFSNSLRQCLAGPRRGRLRAALSTLSSDPLFAEIGVLELLNRSKDDWQQEAETMFDSLSSGHAVVLLTITRLVELVEERTIVLVDEPECHLHPPLLSAFIRALSDLLVKRNGVALISTHSPVVLQEVPKVNVWKLNRVGGLSVANRPVIESFGENVGILTREIFQLEVTASGFHRLLESAINDENSTYEKVVSHFGNQLGSEARGIVRALLALRDRANKVEGGQPL